MKYLIEGGNQLNGEVNISGAKNSVLPVLAANIMVKDCAIKNIPNLSDVKYTKEILEHAAYSTKIPSELSNKMRSSILFAGAMLSEYKEVEIQYPGGCQIGKRPVDMHIDVLKQMGAEIKINENVIIAKTNKLKGCHINLPYVSVGVTENIILAGVKADGVTIIENAAIEPEIIDLINFLNTCGGKIKIKGRTIYIKGVKSLHSAEYTIMPDRIEAITYICAGAITGGELFLNNISDRYIKSPLELLKGMGIIVKSTDTGIYIDSPKKLKSIKHFKTGVYPSIPTDIQPQLSALLTVADGNSHITETIFSNRISHTIELNKMGADITIINNREYIVSGVDKLNSSIVNAYDLRGGAAMIIAALKADGTTLIENSYHIKRGYENITQKINSIGGNIKEI